MHALNIGAQCPGYIELMLPSRPGELCSMPPFAGPPSKLSGSGRYASSVPPKGRDAEQFHASPIVRRHYEEGSLATAFQ
jgi:hypothetical protein